MIGKDAHGVATDAEKRGVAKADETAKAERKVEADASDGKDHRAGGEGNDKGFIRGIGPERNGEKRQKQGSVQKVFTFHISVLPRKDPKV